MKRQSKKDFTTAICMLISFLLWTTAVKLIDVQPIGPQESAVGFATINSFFHNLTGVHTSLYVITDLLSLVPVAFVIGFSTLGLIQWIKRKSLLNVDYSILILGVFYIVVIVIYLLFEFVIINYRPVLIDGRLEASYPSSTTMLVMCTMPTAIMQLGTRIKNGTLKKIVSSLITIFTVFMVVGRCISGVHWLSDVIGGFFLSTGLVLTYRAIIATINK